MKKERKHTEDAKKKIGNAHKGENSSNTNFTWEIVTEIRKKYEIGDYTQRELAKEYNISSQGMNQILTHKRWKINE